MKCPVGLAPFFLIEILGTDFTDLVYVDVLRGAYWKQRNETRNRFLVHVLFSSKI
jgi:hypothetical protein